MSVDDKVLDAFIAQLVEHDWLEPSWNDLPWRCKHCGATHGSPYTSATTREVFGDDEARAEIEAVREGIREMLAAALAAEDVAA